MYIQSRRGKSLKERYLTSFSSGFYSSLSRGNKNQTEEEGGKHRAIYARIRAISIGNSPENDSSPETKRF